MIDFFLCPVKFFPSTNSIQNLATWYYPAIGACGWLNLNSDHIVALSTIDYAGGSHCGRMIRVSHKEKSVDVRVVDLCPGCQGAHGIDLSPGAFQALSTLPIGIVPVEWHFL
ncbi:hypothetical protein CVT24_010197 [Panaeolus cyanescens]|uniref:RlpA-like protein double-psi beta-barrel domain-containing protein n=1 Tax=Panaeolus cyanescens TaxID=181874 RepID=A0A409YPX7_9AGAR|nr:hypothetical protein CVT24_010197 [Panaeolus cyanescens]